MTINQEELSILLKIHFNKGYLTTKAILNEWDYKRIPSMVEKGWLIPVGRKKRYHILNHQNKITYVIEKAINNAVDNIFMLINQYPK